MARPYPTVWTCELWTPSHPGDSNVHRASLADRSIGFLYSVLLSSVGRPSRAWLARRREKREATLARSPVAGPPRCPLCVRENAASKNNRFQAVARVLDASVVAQWQICRGISWTTLGPQSAALWVGAKVLWARAPAQTAAGDHGDSNTTGSSSSSFRHRRDNSPIGRSSCRRTGSGRTCGGCR